MGLLQKKKIPEGGLQTYKGGLQKFIEDNEISFDYTAGQEGRLCIVGKHLGRYIGDSEKLNERYYAINVDGEDVFLTPDYGCVGEDGNICIQGRQDAVVKRNGKQINLEQLDRLAVEYFQEAGLLASLSIAKIYFNLIERPYISEGLERTSTALCLNIIPTSVLRFDSSKPLDHWDDETRINLFNVFYKMKRAFSRIVDVPSMFRMSAADQGGAFTPTTARGKLDRKAPLDTQIRFFC